MLFDVQTVTSKTKSDNTKAIAIIDAFTRYGRAVPISDERRETLTKALTNEGMSISRTEEKLLSDRGPSITGLFLPNFAEYLQVKHLNVYLLHP